MAFRVRISEYIYILLIAYCTDFSITFEHVPSDYAVLKMTVVPETGGDTIWASGYEAYDRLSPAWKRFAEALTATHHNVRILSLPLHFDPS
jgi:alpha-ketoglutarate-dependent taurine dioxygenase